MTEQSYSSVVRPDPNGSNALKRIRQWVEKCQTECTYCNDSSAQSLASYPTRLIDVSQPPLRLVITASLKPEERLPYVTLSHCWGGNRYFTTQRGTLSKRLRGFAMADLPATFRDAISLTRSLNIRYLWIDSVCIIQDDREDWQIESSRMCDVYSNAHLTIAATLASDDSQGFLRHRQSKLTCIELIYPDQDTIRFFLQPNNASNSYYSDSCDGPLHLRAWTFQERLISRRVLGFASNQMYWECRGHKQRKESGYSSIPPGYLALLRPFGTNEDFMGLWHRLVEEYSERHLSDPMDKLVALKAFVERFAATSNDTCISGLWRRHLLEDLMWRPYPGGSYSHPPEYRAPSWSWASIDGPVWYHERKEWRSVGHALVEKINVKLEHSDDRRCHIIIQGSVLDIPPPVNPQPGLNVICASVIWDTPFGCGGFTTIPTPTSAKIDILLDSKNDYSIHANITMGVILNIQMQSKERRNTLGDFDKCRAVGLLLRRPGLGHHTLTQHYQDFAKPSEESFGSFERIGVFESEWLDTWTLQQFCAYGTRRERITIF